MRFEVDTNRVSQTVTKMTELIRNISNGKSQMMNAVGSLSTMWEGEAHDAFLAQVQVDDGELQTLVQDLDAIAERFDQARIAYDNCENKAMETIAAITV